MFYTLDKNKENIKCQLQTKTNLDNLPKNESVEKSKKRKSKNSNKQSIKKIKTITNNSPQIEAVDKNSEIINEDTNSGVIASKTFEKKFKNKKDKKFKNNSIKSNNETKKIDENSLVSPKIEAVDIKPELLVSANQAKLTNKTNQINEDANSGVFASKTFEKKLKKKTNKQTNDNSTKPNDKTKKIDKKLSTTNSS